MECTLGLGCLLFGAVANQSSALGQAKVKRQQRAVLHADCPQGGAINLAGIFTMDNEFKMMGMIRLNNRQTKKQTDWQQ